LSRATPRNKFDNKSIEQETKCHIHLNIVQFFIKLASSENYITVNTRQTVVSNFKRIPFSGTAIKHHFLKKQLCLSVQKKSSPVAQQYKTQMLIENENKSTKTTNSEKLIRSVCNSSSIKRYYLLSTTCGIISKLTVPRKLITPTDPAMAL